MELLDWLWRQIWREDPDYYGSTLETALHHLTPEQEIEKLEKQDREDILYRYEELQYYHTPKETRAILMEERGLQTEALDKALYRARAKKKKEREQRERELKKHPRTKKKMSDDSDIPF
jgi:hypothetical protein